MVMSQTQHYMHMVYPLVTQPFRSAQTPMPYITMEHAPTSTVPTILLTPSPKYSLACTNHFRVRLICTVANIYIHCHGNMALCAMVASSNIHSALCIESGGRSTCQETLAIPQSLNSIANYHPHIAYACIQSVWSPFCPQSHLVLTQDM